jgi:hypothetical protein
MALIDIALLLLSWLFQRHYFVPVCYYTLVNNIIKLQQRAPRSLKLPCGSYFMSSANAALRDRRFV